MIPLLVTIPVAGNDIGLVSSMLSHLQQLGPPPNHAVLFVADHGLSRSTLDPILAQAKPIFINGGGLVFSAIPMTPAYPNAHNLRFETALRHISTNERCPFLWLDPRCVPTRKGWLTELEREYFARRKPVMGQVLTPATHGTAQPLVSSIAVYSPDLPKRILQRLIAQRGVDWEKSCADLLLPIAHDTMLIWVHPVNSTNALPNPPAQAALVHTAQARAYAAVVQGKKPDPVVSSPELVNVPAAHETPKPPVVVKPASNAIYYHSGNLGDVIYSLAAIRLAGGGQLILGPKQWRTSPCDKPIREDSFEMLKPLLAAQPYLSNVTFSELYPRRKEPFDLNTYRDKWNDPKLRATTGINNLARMHCHILGVDEKFHPSDTWLTVQKPIVTDMFTVHRSSRFRNDTENKFPWETIIKRYAGRLLFVGQASEHAEFCKTFSCRTAFWKCQDFLELARVIAGSLGFIGNQSFPCAIAIGLGQRVLQETWQTSPDCVFVRPNFLSQPFAISALEKWDGNEAPKEVVKSDIPKPETKNPLSVTKQTRWDCKLFQFPDEKAASDSELGICHFNPCVERVNGELLLFTRRLRYSKTKIKPDINDQSSISIFKLNDDKNPTLLSNPQLPLRFPTENWEDPRTIQLRGNVYVSCCTWANGKLPIRQTVGILNKELSKVSRIGELPIEGNHEKGPIQQKNWTYFAQEDDLFMIYTIAPFVVYAINSSWKQGSKFADTSNWQARWKYGVPRGGSNPVLHNGEYVSFFHSSLPWKGRQRRYYMGAVMFDPTMPFAVKRFTTEPLLIGSEQDPREQNGPLVVFPGGAVMKNGKWLVVFGVNDEKCGWIEIPHDELMALTVPVA